MEVTNVVEFQELEPDEQLFAEGDESEVRVLAKREKTPAMYRVGRTDFRRTTNTYSFKREWCLALERRTFM